MLAPPNAVVVPAAAVPNIPAEEAVAPAEKAPAPFTNAADSATNAGAAAPLAVTPPSSNLNGDGVSDTDDPNGFATFNEAVPPKVGAGLTTLAADENENGVATGVWPVSDIAAAEAGLEFSTGRGVDVNEVVAAAPPMSSGARAKVVVALLPAAEALEILLVSLATLATADGEPNMGAAELVAAPASNSTGVGDDASADAFDALAVAESGRLGTGNAVTTEVEGFSLKAGIFVEVVPDVVLVVLTAEETVLLPNAADVVPTAGAAAALSEVAVLTLPLRDGPTVAVAADVLEVLAAVVAAPDVLVSEVLPATVLAAVAAADVLASEVAPAAVLPIVAAAEGLVSTVAAAVLAVVATAEILVSEVAPAVLLAVVAADVLVSEVAPAAVQAEVAAVISATVLAVVVAAAEALVSEVTPAAMLAVVAAAMVLVSVVAPAAAADIASRPGAAALAAEPALN